MSIQKWSANILTVVTIIIFFTLVITVLLLFFLVQYAKVKRQLNSERDQRIAGQNDDSSIYLKEQILLKEKMGIMELSALKKIQLYNDTICILNSSIFNINLAYLHFNLYGSKRRVSFSEIIENCRVIAYQELDKMNINLHIDIKSNGKTDKEKAVNLTLLLANCICQAIQRTTKNGDIYIKLIDDAGSFIIEITDFGYLVDPYIFNHTNKKIEHFDLLALSQLALNLLADHTEVEVKRKFVVYECNKVWLKIKNSSLDSNDFPNVIKFNKKQ